MSERLKSKLILIGVNIMFATAFVATKGAMEVLPMYLLTALRLLIAAICVSFMFRDKLKTINRDTILYGSIIGIFYITGIILQTYGVKYTDAGRTSFLTASYVIMMPFLEWWFLKLKPTVSKFAAAIIGLVGIGLVVLTSGFTIEMGDMFTILASVSFAFYILLTGIYAKKLNPEIFTIFLFLIGAIVCFILSFAIEGVPTKFDLKPFLYVVYLGVFCSGIPLVIQNKIQKTIEPSFIALMCGVQAMFATIFSVIIFGEAISLQCFIGFILILVAIFCTR